jgi:thiol-disulfide isomerase/thioredoxin
MKKHLSTPILLFVASFLSFQSCKKDIAPVPTETDVFTVSPTESSVGSEGSTLSVTVTTNLTYSVTSMPSWVAETTSKATASKTHTFSVAANASTSARSGAIVFTSSSKKSISVNVKQGGASAVALSLDPEIVSAEAAGTSKSVTVTSNYAWTVSSDKDWCTISPSNGTGNGSFTVSVSANESTDSRTATVTVKAGTGDNTATKTITVTQAGKEPDVFELSQTDFSVGREGGAISVTVTTNLTYKVESTVSWITETASTKSTASKTHTFTISANPDVSSRSGVITFCTSANQCVPVNVTQAGMPAAALSLDPEVFSSKASGESKAVTVTSNYAWTAVSDKDWCTVSPSNGTGNGSLTITTAANGVFEPRTATVTVSAGSGNNSVAKTIVVTQSAGENEGTSWVNKTFHHRSLVMKFTATWCVNCPYMAKTIEEARKKYPDKIEEVNMHPNSSELRFSGADVLSPYYYIHGYPTAIMDNRVTLTNACPYFGEVLQETEANYPTVTAAAFNSSISGYDLTVNMNVYVKKADSYNITVLVLEDGIVGYQCNDQDPTPYDYVHNGVARLSLTDVRGDKMDIAKDGTVWMHTYKATLPSGWNKSNLRILVYVMRPYGSQARVKGVSGVTYPDFGNYYVDNALSGKVGEEVRFDSGDNEGIIVGPYID